MNVVFFTYRDAADQIYVSATTRGRAFLDDSVFGHVKTAVLRVIRRWLEGLEVSFVILFLTLRLKFLILPSFEVPRNRRGAPSKRRLTTDKIQCTAC